MERKTATWIAMIIRPRPQTRGGEQEDDGGDEDTEEGSTGNKLEFSWNSETGGDTNTP
jgi:hypothetical protein